MNRAGILAIVLAAAVTGACGGADEASPSPTSPTPTPTTTNSQPQPTQTSCVPTNLTASVSNSSVTLQWNGVSGATEYLILVGSVPSSSDRLSTNTTNNNYTWTAQPGRQYARVQARCGGNFGSSSNEAEFTVAGSSAD